MKIRGKTWKLMFADIFVPIWLNLSHSIWKHLQKCQTLLKHAEETSLSSVWWKYMPHVSDLPFVNILKNHVPFSLHVKNMKYFMLATGNLTDIQCRLKWKIRLWVQVQEEYYPEVLLNINTSHLTRGNQKVFPNQQLYHIPPVSSQFALGFPCRGHAWNITKRKVFFISSWNQSRWHVLMPPAPQQWDSPATLSITLICWLLHLLFWSWFISYDNCWSWERVGKWTNCQSMNQIFEI